MIFFKHAAAILGKSTFYDILNGSISMTDCSAHVRIDKRLEPATLHSIEKCRTMVLQDSNMDALVWEFLRLVQIDEFVRDELEGDLDVAMENKLSGGQKTRLLLARALYRVQQRSSSLLILDEPDKGLPAETTLTIIENIMKWYRSKGILFLTLHTERAHLLHFDQVLHVEQGTITRIK
jgi:ABC-type transport system involved in cytochrome bd biosynthesis fused ATPase/permease subunit